MTSVCLILITVLKPVIVDHILDRPLTWDPSGIVRIETTQKIPDAERDWIREMKLGDYGKVFLSASYKSRLSKPTFFQLWIVSETCRKRNTLLELRRFSEEIKNLYPGSPEAIYIQIKYESLSLAQAIKTRDQTRMDRSKRDLALLFKTAEPDATDHLPLAVLLGGLYLDETLKKRALSERLAKKYPDVHDLKLWRIRTYLNGSFSSPIGKNGKILRTSDGRPLVRISEDSPNLENAAKLLDNYSKVVPHDLRSKFYRARLLSMNAAFVAKDLKEANRLTSLTKQLLEEVRTAYGMPKPMVEVAERFRSLPFPGTFKTLPSE